MAQVTYEHRIKQLDPPVDIANNPDRLQNWLNDVYTLIGEKVEWSGNVNSSTTVNTTSTLIINQSITDTLREGDTFLVLLNFKMTKGGSTGDSWIRIEDTLGGSSNGRWNAVAGQSLIGSQPYAYYENHPANGNFYGTIAGVYTVDGVSPPLYDDLNFVVRAQSSGSASTINTGECALYTWLLHRGSRAAR